MLELQKNLSKIGLTLGQFYLFNVRTGEYSLHKKVIHKPQEKPLIQKLRNTKQVHRNLFA